jgi:hypothetical protein
VEQIIRLLDRVLAPPKIIDLAYCAALEERTRERVPLDWDSAQNNLGAALSTLGERETGAEELEQAVAAYHAALDEWTRERVPYNLSGVRARLTNPLRLLDERRELNARERLGTR